MAGSCDSRRSVRQTATGWRGTSPRSRTPTGSARSRWSTARRGSARPGRIYYNGLLDENAAAHIAFGSGFAKTRTVPVGRERHGVNRSKTHIDVMIGTDALEADGIRQSGKRVAPRQGRPVADLSAR